MKNLYSFVKECGMCAAGLTGGAYETPATNSGNFFDVYGNKKKKQVKPKKKSKLHINRRIKGMNVLD